MDITNQTGQIDEELQLLKTEIKQVLHNVQENVFSAQDPFSGSPTAGTEQGFTSLDEVAVANPASAPSEVDDSAMLAPEFATDAEGELPAIGSIGNEEFPQASPAELSDFLASAGDEGDTSLDPAPSPTLLEADLNDSPDLGSALQTSEAVAEQAASYREAAAEQMASYEEEIILLNDEEPAADAMDQIQAIADSAFATSGEFESPASEATEADVSPVQPEPMTSEPPMALSEEMEMDPQATIDAMLAEAALATSEESPSEAAFEMPTPEPKINFEPETAFVGSVDEPEAEEAPSGAFLHAGKVPPLPAVEPPEISSPAPAPRQQQDVFSKAALTYAMAPSHGNGHGDQRAGDESMDLVTIAGLAQWAHGVLQRYGKEYLAAILEISQLTGRITKDTQEIIMTISPLLETAASEKGMAAKQIVSMLAQLDAFLGTVSASDSRLLPFLLQDDMEVFPLIRP